MAITAPGIWPGATIGAISGTAVTITNSYAPVLATPSATITGTLAATFVGAGTLSLSGTAATSVSGALVLHDDLAAINSAVAAATSIRRAAATAGGVVFLSAVESLDGSGIYPVEGLECHHTIRSSPSPLTPLPCCRPPIWATGFRFQSSGKNGARSNNSTTTSSAAWPSMPPVQLSYTTSSPTGTNIWPAVISPGRYVAGGATFSATDVYVDNLLIQLPANPNFGAISFAGSLEGDRPATRSRFGRKPQRHANRCVWIASPPAPIPSASPFPQDANEVRNVCGQDEAVGVYYGFIGGEHLRLDRPVTFYCEYSLYIPSTAGVHTIVGSMDLGEHGLRLFQRGRLPGGSRSRPGDQLTPPARNGMPPTAGGAGNTNTSSLVGVIRYSINYQRHAGRR